MINYFLVLVNGVVVAKVMSNEGGEGAVEVSLDTYAAALPNAHTYADGELYPYTPPPIAPYKAASIGVTAAATGTIATHAG